jgi:hypothetical protein
VPDLVGEGTSARVVVVVGHAHEHAQAGADRADGRTVDVDPRLRDPLHQPAHEVKLRR